MTEQSSSEAVVVSSMNSMGCSDSLPHFCWAPKREKFEAWHEITRPLYDTAPTTSERQFEVRCEAYLIDDVVVNRCSFGPHTLARRRHHLRVDDSDHLAFRMYLRGQTRQAVGEDVVLMSPNAITLVDRRHEMHGRSDAADVLGVLIPRRRLDSRLFDKTPAFMWSVDSPQGRLLAGAASNLWAELPRARAADGAALAAGFTGLLQGLLAYRPYAERQAALEKATLAAMRQFIDRHLDDPDLGTERLCRTFHCSRASLYRLFTPLGGIMRHVQGRRLQRCFEQLVGGSPEPRVGGRTVAAVARHWGFDCPSHFRRLFKARFQMTPSDALAIGCASQDPATWSSLDRRPDIERVHRWLQRL